MLPLKGNKAQGQAVLASVEPVETGQRYLVMSLGGSVAGTDLVATPQLSVVPLGSLDVTSLKDKPLKEQVLTIFQHRLGDVQSKLKRLDAERKLLEVAVGNPTE